MNETPAWFSPITTTAHLLIRCCCLLVGAIFLTACTTATVEPVQVPAERLEGWARGGDPVSVATPWLTQFESAELSELVASALQNNYQLRRSRARVSEVGYGVTIAGAPLWPSLSATLDSSRRRAVFNTAQSANALTAANNLFNLGIRLNWQVDVWGELSAAQRAARLSFASELANYVAAEQQLAADVARRYFAAVEAAALAKVLEARLESLQSSLDIVESGYRSGLNGALDVYLAQNSVAQETGNLAAQQQSVLETRAQLELLLAHYPAGAISTPDVLPELSAPLPVDLPSTLLTRRPDLQSSWLQVLSSDARLAVAHRQRFPSFVLSASLADAEAPFNELLNGGPLAWSLLGSLAQPVFQGGRLRAAERQAKEQLAQTEAIYIDTVFTAFAEVENGISQAQALEDQLQAARAASRNAEGALELSLEQYQSGLITFTTVLESQRRAFDAETAQVRLAAAQLQNRIALNLALGGVFDEQASQDQRISALFEQLSGHLRRTREQLNTQEEVSKKK